MKITTATFSPNRPKGLGKKAIILAALTSWLCIAILCALAIGAVSLNLGNLLYGDLTAQQEAVLFSIRLPRILLTLIVGAGLAVSGAAMQGLFRNPLADPGLIGITSGAAFSVAILIVLAEPLTGVLGLYSLSLAAFIGGVLTCIIIFWLAKKAGNFSTLYMLLAGIAINALAGAGTGFLTYLSDDDSYALSHSGQWVALVVHFGLRCWFRPLLCCLLLCSLCETPNN